MTDKNDTKPPFPDLEGSPPEEEERPSDEDSNPLGSLVGERPGPKGDGEHVRTTKIRVTSPTARKTISTFPEGMVIAGRYRVIQFIAAGGMGEVYEVEDAERKNRK